MAQIATGPADVNDAPPYPELDVWSKTLLGEGEKRPDLLPEIRRLVDALFDQRVLLAFGGHFKSGKSLLINAAMRRRLLPVDKLPETGISYRIRQGKQDRALVVQGGNRQKIHCTTQALRTVSSLIASSGARRNETQAIDWVDLSLKNTAIAPQAEWLDTPGVNDTQEMNQRAMWAFRQADMLLWVLSSKQLLAESEMEFISEYMAERGPASVVFIINGFLERDDEQGWKELCATQLPRHISKILDLDFATSMGFTRELPPVVVTCSAHAAAQQSTPGMLQKLQRMFRAPEKEDYGLAQLDRLVGALSNRSHPRIQRSRLLRARAQLINLDADFGRWYDGFFPNLRR